MTSHCPIPDEPLGARFLGAVASTERPPKPYPFPVPTGYITSLFGPREHPVTGVSSGRNHGALDIGAQPGAIGKPILAPASGKVTWYNGDVTKREGRYLIIKHDDGWTTSYSHLSSTSLRKGNRVSKGQVIGLMGNSGSSTTGPHLHWVVKNPAGVRVDPIEVMKGNLPLSSNLSKVFGSKTIPGMHPAGPTVFFLAGAVALGLYLWRRGKR